MVLSTHTVTELTVTVLPKKNVTVGFVPLTWVIVPSDPRGQFPILIPAQRRRHTIRQFARAAAQRGARNIANGVARDVREVAIVKTAVRPIVHRITAYRQRRSTGRQRNHNQSR